MSGPDGPLPLVRVAGMSGSSTALTEVPAARRTLIRKAWHAFLTRGRVEFASVDGAVLPPIDRWTLSGSDLLVGLWDVSSGSWRSPDMMARCVAVSKAANGRLLVTMGAPGERDMLLFDKGQALTTSGGEVCCYTAVLDRGGGIRFVPVSAEDGVDAGRAIACAPSGLPPMQSRRCAMVNLVDWRSLASGSAQHQLGLLRAWRRAGYDVRMIAPGPRVTSGLPPDLVAAIRFSPSFRQVRLPSSLDTLTEILSLMAMRVGWKPDVVFSRVNSLTALLVLACRIMQLRVIIDHNGWLSKERIEAGGNRLLARLEEWSQVTAARLAHGSRCVTGGMAEALRQQGIAEDRLCVVGNGTDTEEFRPLDRTTARSAFGLRIDRHYIGFLGNVVPWHRVDVAVAAFASIAARFPDWDLVIFGDGPTVGDLRQQARNAGVADRILFMGRVDSDRANLAINCFNLGIVPLTKQRDTAFGYSPVKIRDYASAGCPVLTGAVPDNLELDGQGWLFTHAPDDPKAMADRLAQLLESPEGLREGALLARAYAVSHFDWDEIGGEIMRRLDSGSLAAGHPDAT